MEKICSECSEMTLAQSLCTLCNKWLCCQCTDVHQHQTAAASSLYADLHDQHRPELPQKGSGSLPTTGPGTGSYPCSLLMCHSHGQQPLELLCESCDLLCCSSCHLSSHKTHRVVQIGKALQDQRWLFESLMVQVEERRSAVENNAKQIEDRVHGVKIAHSKAENQIKMAKMIMMNELNKRANLLIEQLEKISEDLQQPLEDQLQGAIETCAQLDHVQKFISWATTHHCRGPVLFSRRLISLQIQELLDSSLQSEAWSPVKIKFNWDASYWTKQMSSLGQLTVEGGNCPYPQGLACSTVPRPQPITCLALTPVYHRGREPACGYQMCYEPQVCCIHGLPSQSQLDKSQLGGPLYNSSYVPTGPGCQVQSQQLLKCWHPSDSSALQTYSQCPSPPSHAPVMGPIQTNCSRGPASQTQASTSESQSLSESHLHHHHQRGPLPVSKCQQSEKQPQSRPSRVPCQEMLQNSASLQEVQDIAAEESQDERCRVEESHEPTVVAELEEEQPGRSEKSHVQQQQQQFQVSPPAEVRKEQQRIIPTPMLRGQTAGRRSTSLEVSVTANNCGSDAQHCQFHPSSACTNGKRCSQSTSAELAAPSGSSYSERPTGSPHCSDERTANMYASADCRQRRASDGVLCIVKETSADVILSRSGRSPLFSYKTEPDPSYLNDDVRHDAKEKYSVSRNGHNGDSQGDSGRARVPVVCLERLKVLISQLPPHGRRQSDPLPASTTEKATLQQQTWQDVTYKGVSRGPDTSRTRAVTASQSPDNRQWLTVDSEWDTCPRASFVKASTLPTDDCHENNSALDSDSDSEPQLVSEEAVVHCQVEPQLDSDTSPEFSSETELEVPGKENDVLQSCNRNDSMGGYDRCDAFSETASGAGSEDVQSGPDADADSGAAETESDGQPEVGILFQAETDSDHLSDQHVDSQESVESELDIESEHETTDEPQPLRSDLEEEYPIGPGQRPLLIANPRLPRRTEEVEEDSAQIESEDFCGVCLIGGDLLCCDGCPKVYHLSCHIPPLLSFPSGDWLCSLCRDVVQPQVEYDCENRRASGEHTSGHGLSACDQRKCERLTLLILNNILSAPFHEPVSPLARHYYQIIKRPIDLSVIRARLNKTSTQHYNSTEQFVADVYLMFHNCAKFNYPDSEVAQAGRNLETFFTSKLKEVFPGRVFPVAEADSDSDEYDEAVRATESGFPWPERREQCHRKRKRRQSLKSRRHHIGAMGISQRHSLNTQQSSAGNLLRVFVGQGR